MESTLRSYNQEQPVSLAGEAGVCRSAGVGLQRLQSQLVQTPAPAQYHSVTSAVRKAYVLARKAFSDCALAARSLSYPLMTQAEHEVAQANAWIDRAHRADH